MVLVAKCDHASRGGSKNGSDENLIQVMIVVMTNLKIRKAVVNLMVVVLAKIRMVVVILMVVVLAKIMGRLADDYDSRSGVRRDSGDGSSPVVVALQRW